MSSKTKQDITSFINNIIEKNYSAANKNVSSAVSKIIKQKIINNNKDLF